MSNKQVTKIFAKDSKACPSIAYKGDAGIDLCYAGQDSVEINNNIIYRLPTGLHVEIPEGKCGVIFERSGLGAKYGINIVGRIIDSGYRGEIIVLMNRNSEFIRDLTLDNPVLSNVNPLVFNKGDKIAQMVIVDCFTEFAFVDKFEDLSTTVRGQKGLGSSGK